jgi:hypothetical protein
VEVRESVFGFGGLVVWFVGVVEWTKCFGVDRDFVQIRATRDLEKRGVGVR